MSFFKDDVQPDPRLDSGVTSLQLSGHPRGEAACGQTRCTCSLSPRDTSSSPCQAFYCVEPKRQLSPEEMAARREMLALSGYAVMEDAVIIS